MKKLNYLFFGLLAFLFSSDLKTQILEPVKWETSVVPLGNDEFVLSAVAKIDNKWHIYSIEAVENGPIATEIIFDGKGTSFEINDALKEPKPEKVYDKNFMMDIKWHSNKAIFSQKIKLKKNIDKINAEVTFMACDDTQCLPPTTETLVFNLKQNSLNDINAQFSNDEKTAQVDNIAPINNDENSTKDKTLFSIFIFAFIAGILALLTPCVFPMIPMTVSFFMKRHSEKTKSIRDALIYGLSIILIYLALGIGVSAIFGPAALNELSTDPYFNLFFFVLLVIFALAFLGAFELTLPSSWVNKMDAKSDKKGFIGIFFMAFTLALVSFSCTGPFIGTILVEAASKGNFWGPTIGMLGFATALALPFTIFAIFPKLLNGLPKSGGWLNSVKVVLGLLELAFALKFLSNADLVWDLHILEREIFVAIWVVIFAIMGFYLLGKINFPHDTPKQTTSVTGAILAIIALSFSVYMLPGVWGAPVKIISAFAPPSNYAEITTGLNISSNQNQLNLDSDIHEGPQGIPVFTDYYKALEYAKKINKPLLVDFTGKACVNCRKMEAEVWSDPIINSKLKNDFVVVELFVDYREKLPQSEQYTNKKGKKITTVGQKWTDFQIERFGKNSQPLYVILDTQEKQIAPTRAFDLDKKAFLHWLEMVK